MPLMMHWCRQLPANSWTLTIVVKRCLGFDHATKQLRICSTIGTAYWSLMSGAESEKSELIRTSYCFLISTWYSPPWNCRHGLCATDKGIRWYSAHFSNVGHFKLWHAPNSMLSSWKLTSLAMHADGYAYWYGRPMYTWFEMPRMQHCFFAQVMSTTNREPCTICLDVVTTGKFGRIIVKIDTEINF